MSGLLRTDPPRWLQLSSHFGDVFDRLRQEVRYHFMTNTRSDYRYFAGALLASDVLADVEYALIPTVELLIAPESLFGLQIEQKEGRHDQNT